MAWNNAPLVTEELLQPVSATSCTFSNPVCFTKARKSFPGMVPPSHLAQLATLALIALGSSPTRIWSAIISRPPGFKNRTTSERALALSGIRLKTPLEMTTSRPPSATLVYFPRIPSSIFRTSGKRVLPSEMPMCPLPPSAF